MATDFSASRERFRSTALTAWLMIGCLLSLTLLFNYRTFLPTEDSALALTRPRADFMVFYAAGKLAAESPADLYDPVRQAAAQASATGLRISSNDLGFNAFGYPPVVAVLFIPFTLLDYTTAYFAMMLANLLLAGFGLWLLSSRLDLTRGKNKILVLCTAALFPVYATLVQGQVSLLMFVIFSLVILNLRDGHVERAGGWAGLIALKPTLVPIVFCWFLIRRHWKAFGYALGVSSLLAVGSMILIGADGVTAYIDLSRTLFNGDTVLSQPLDTVNLRAVVHFLGWGDRAWLAAAGSVVLLLWFGRRRGPRQDWEYCALVLGTLLASRHALVHSLTLTLIVVALVLAHYAGSVPARFRWFLFLMMMLPALYTATMAGPGGLHWPFIPLVMTVLFVYFATQPLPAMTGQRVLNKA